MNLIFKIDKILILKHAFKYMTNILYFNVISFTVLFIIKYILVTIDKLYTLTFTLYVQLYNIVKKYFV